MPRPQRPQIGEEVRSRVAVPGRLAGGYRQSAGNVAVAFALFLSIMLLGVASAIDGVAWLHARTAVMGAVDAAVLAGARELQASAGSEELAVAKSVSVYENTVRRLPAGVRSSITFSVADAGTAMLASGAAFVATRGLKVFGLDELAVVDGDGGVIARGAVVLGHNARQHIELALVLDVSAKTAGAVFDAMMAGASDLVSLLLWAEQDHYTLRLSLVPFASAVRPSDNVWLRLAPAQSLRPLVQMADGRTARLGRTACVGERAGRAAVTDAAPLDFQEFPPVYAVHPVCFPSAPITPLTEDRSTLGGAIDHMQPGGFSAPHIGLAWAWYALSPQWSVIWPSAPRAYSAAPAAQELKQVRKVVLLVATPDFDVQYCRIVGQGMTAAVADISSAGALALKAACSADAASLDQALALCAAMKEAGIEIHTLALPFGHAPGPLPAANDVLRQCASEPANAYSAATAADIRQVMRLFSARLAPVYLAN